MSFPYATRFLMLSMLLFGGAANAARVTIGFEGVAGETELVSGFMSHAELGMVVTADAEHGIFGKNYSGPEMNGSNGTAVFGWCNGVFLCSTPGQVISLERGDSSVFNLNALDASWGIIFGPDEELMVTGYFADGASISSNLTVADDWNTFNFDSAWSDLVRVELNGTCTNTGGLCMGFAIDNLVITTVPIPAAVWLFASALAGLGWARRRGLSSVRHTR